MPKEFSIDVTLEELGMAYRKAKVDMFYTSLPVKEKIVNYERTLVKNLEKLQQKLLVENNDWFKSEEFLGSWTLDPKGIRPLNKKSKEVDRIGNTIICSDPKKQWDLSRIDEEKQHAEFRLMADLSIDFHIISTLWMQKVGHKFDKSLSDDAYGSRLRRKDDGEINPLAIGSFSNYLQPFRRWRENGINAMRQALKDEKNVIAITADITSYYHKLSPEFFKSYDFQKQVLDEILQDDEMRLNILFVNALIAWASGTPLKRGLPVGLPASAIIANCALIDLDLIIRKEITPVYYGRYIDDIILVLESRSQFKGSEQVWDWIISRTNKYLSKEVVEEDNSLNIIFSTPYLLNSEILFGNEKNKTFLLSGKTGETLLDSISQQMQNQASEWRALPNISIDPNKISLSMLNNTEELDEADNLRKVSNLAFCRSKFALTLRDIEAYQRNLSPKSWEKQRKAFLQAFIDHVLVIPVFFELSKYLSRVIQIATICEDFEELAKILKSVKEIKEDVNSKFTVSIKGMDSCVISKNLTSIIKSRWRKHQRKYILESITSAFSNHFGTSNIELYKKFLTKKDLGYFYTGFDRVKRDSRNYFVHDLGYIPVKNALIEEPRELSVSFTSICDDSTRIISTSIIDGLEILNSELRLVKEDEYPFEMAFLTRPPSMNEVLQLFCRVYNRTSLRKISFIMNAFRGFELHNDVIDELTNSKIKVIQEYQEYIDRCLQKKLSRKSNQKVFKTEIDENVNKFTHISKFKYIRENIDKIKIGISSWETTNEQWKASVNGNPDLSLERYQRFVSLLNRVMKDINKPEYFVLPELACPANWFMFFANKLQKKKISLISGVEYIHHKDDKQAVSNQTWAALSFDGFDFPYWILHRQDKQRPAIHEEHELFVLNDKKLVPMNEWKTPPIINHGGFYFAILNCSEITNIEYRAFIRGKVDALFAIEWNKDTESFKSIVEASALDIHAYIIQCNDRQYGDSRIRAPYKNSWERDIVRVKGGESDYYVIGEIDIKALRKFQQNHRSPEQPFKPMPDGFKLSPERSDFSKKGIE